MKNLQIVKHHGCYGIFQGDAPYPINGQLYRTDAEARQALQEYLDTPAPSVPDAPGRSRIRRRMIARCVREAILFSIVGDFPKQQIRQYRKDLHQATTQDLVRECRMSAYHDYPRAQVYLKNGGINNRRKALRVLTGAHTNLNMS